MTGFAKCSYAFRSSQNPQKKYQMKTIIAAGQKRLLALKPRLWPCGTKLLQRPRLHASTRETWDAAIDEGDGDLTIDCQPIMDQTDRPDCWAYATIMCYEVSHALDGCPIAQLTPDTLPYITSQWDGGAIDSGICIAGPTYGFNFAADLPPSDPILGVHVPDVAAWPTTWQQLAARNRTITNDWIDCANFDDVGDSLIDGWPCVIGVDWQGGGHALCALELGGNSQTGYWLSGPNSWGKNWNDGYGSRSDRPGWFQLREDQCAAIQSYGAIACCGTTPASAPTT